MPISQQLESTSLTNEEKTILTCSEIAAQISTIPRVKRKGFDIEILEVNSLGKGIEVFVRAWNKNKKVGFGKDGSVEIERFRIFKPPILVEDPNGSIERIIPARPAMGEISAVPETIVRYREDPIEALLRELEHTMSVKEQIFDDSNIKPGKVGSTTTTVYPDAHTETSTVDGMIYYTNNTYSTCRNASSGTSAFPSATFEYCFHGKNGTPYQINRGFFLFDTSAVGSDTVDTATLSLYGNGRGNLDADGDSMVIVSSTPASNTDLVAGDYDQIGLTDTAYASLDITSWSTSAYNAFSFNATGKAAINGSGITKFGFTTQGDLDATTPTGNNGVDVRFADYGGASTTNDPKLVIEHSASAATVTASETLTISEALTSSIGLAVSEVLSLTKTLLQKISSAVTDTITLAESVAADTSIIIGLSDSITLNGTVNLASVLSKTITDTITLADAASAVLGSAQVTVSEILSLSGTVTLSSVFSKAVSDALSLAESIAFLTPGWTFKTKNQDASNWTYKTKNADSDNWTFKNKT